MNLEKLLTAKQLEICKKEQYYYQHVGIKKELIQIAIEHNFIQKKEKFSPYSLDLIKKYKIIISNENTQNFYIECKELLGPKRLEELQKQLNKNVIQHTIPVREFNEKFRALLAVDPDAIEKRIKQFNAFDTDDNEVLSLFEMILAHGTRNGVSDIHINAYEEFSWLRYRLNGKVQARYLLNPELSQTFSLIIK